MLKQSVFFTWGEPNIYLPAREPFSWGGDFFRNNLGGKTFFWEFFNITSFHPFYQFLSELDDFMCHFVENLGGG